MTALNQHIHLKKTKERLYYCDNIFQHMEVSSSGLNYDYM